MNNLPQIDLLSFLSGAVISILLVFIVSQIKKNRPKLQSAFKGQKQAKTKDTRVATDLLLRKYFLRKAQSSHLAASLFPLSKIYVDLKFISRPYYLNPSKPIDDEPAAFSITSNFFEFPELVTELPLPLLNLEESLSAGQNICILGEFGSGKSTALAHLTSQILEKKCELQPLNDLLPLYFHVFELQLSASAEISIPDIICNMIIGKNLDLKHEILQGIINDYLSQKQVIFLIDGLDELPASLLPKYVNLISLIHDRYPDLPIVVTLCPLASVNLTKYNFSYISIQFPDHNLKASLLSKWKIARNEIYRIKNLSESPLDDELTTLWSVQENNNASIFDYTLLCWSFCALDYWKNPQNPVSSYLERVTRSQISNGTLLDLAKTILQSNDHGISAEVLENFIKQDAFFNHLSSAEKQSDESASSIVEPALPLTVISKEKSLIKELVDSHLLTEFSPGQFHFTNPSVTACLAALDERYQKTFDWKLLLESPLEESIVRRSKEYNYLEKWANDSDDIRLRNMRLAVKHSANKMFDSAFQSSLYQNIVSKIQRLAIPFSQKFTLLSILTLRNDPSLSQLLAYFEKSGKNDLLQLSAFAFGYQKDHNRINFLIDCINGSDQSLHLLSILALYRNWNKQSKEIFIELLRNGRENQQKIVAELLSQKEPEGQQILEELSNDKNLLCRKAVTQGLRLVSAEWATLLLEKMSTGDKEWFVRDAAVHALQNRWTKSLYIPQQYENPLDSPWLINYASRTGQSLPEGEYPYGFLYQLINEGTLEEKLTAMSYLAARPDNDTENILINIASSNSMISEEALQSLQHISRTSQL